MKNLLIIASMLIFTQFLFISCMDSESSTAPESVNEDSNDAGGEPSCTVSGLFDGFEGTVCGIGSGVNQAECEQDVSREGIETAIFGDGCEGGAVLICEENGETTHYWGAIFSILSCADVKGKE